MLFFGAKCVCKYALILLFPNQIISKIENGSMFATTAHDSRVGACYLAINEHVDWPRQRSLQREGW